MIRMGRSSKPEPASETTQNYQPQTSTQSPSYQYTNENAAASSRAVTESESLARDIKEGRLSGYVGNGTILTGETTFQAMLRIDGHLTGRVTSEAGTLIVGTTGQVDANILVASAVINGMVNGDVVAMEKLQLGRTARVVGNIQAPRVILEEGAILEGNCSMLKAKEAFDQRSAETREPAYTNGLSSYQTTETEEAAEEEVADAFEVERETEATVN